MHYNFKNYNPKQKLLLPSLVDEWLPQKHLARFISEIVNQLNLSELIKAYRANGQGNAAYHPAVMTKILLYAYCIGMPCSRKTAKALTDNVAFRWLAAGSFPDFRTICELRFPRVLLLCGNSGLVKVGVIILDGTKVKANASLSKNRSYKQLQKKVKELFDIAEDTDFEEDRIYGDRQGDELPEELDTAKKRLARIKEAKKLLEEKAGKETGYCSESNLSDLESRNGIDELIFTRKEQEMRKAKSSPGSRRRTEKYKAMDKQLQRPVERHIYGFGKRIIEPVFGQMKYCHGFSGFFLRDLQKVKGEFSLWCSAHNLLKLYISQQKEAVTA